MAGQERRIDDTMLIREAQRGNRGAFEELVRHYDQAVLRLALHLTGNEPEAQDVYQDAFLKAYKNIGSFRFECSFYTWIYRIVTNLCLDHLRQRYGRPQESESPDRAAHAARRRLVDLLAEELDVSGVADATAAGNPEAQLRAKELSRALAGVLAGFEPRDRLLLKLRFEDGLPASDIGQVMGFATQFHVYRRLNAVLGQVRAAMRGRGVQDSEP